MRFTLRDSTGVASELGSFVVLAVIIVCILYAVCDAVRRRLMDVNSGFVPYDSLDALMLQGLCRMFSYIFSYC